MKYTLVCLLLLLPVILTAAVIAQDVSSEDKIEIYKIALQRSREATTACENNLAEMWAKANDLNRKFLETNHEFEKMKKDYENIKKQLEDTSEGQK